MKVVGTIVDHQRLRPPHSLPTSIEAFLSKPPQHEISLFSVVDFVKPP
jgi:hypothetical protein